MAGMASITEEQYLEGVGVIGDLERGGYHVSFLLGLVGVQDQRIVDVQDLDVGEGAPGQEVMELLPGEVLVLVPRQGVAVVAACGKRQSSVVSDRGAGSRWTGV